MPLAPKIPAFPAAGAHNPVVAGAIREVTH